ncbi:hypothetical protein HanXRQr2_Chr15g0696761 [Helianthus annuus]|uniref:Uncharacterized protein n=1 Tax=Helianthus annuus TaxID=4232 RepID=A0A9K3H4W4_HELAN|nr:hypothetical protein HanXRQr2_Chr15g0696761 [Helianthus annuus]KAJ0831574.1 hypothetical protein HanPSC8_Chr15g0668611 [Helianthus annuus]
MGVGLGPAWTGAAPNTVSLSCVVVLSISLEMFVPCHKKTKLPTNKLSGHIESMMSTHGDDLDLLLSLQDRVLETPPLSPSPGVTEYIASIIKRNLKTAFNFKEKMQSEGIYMVENQTNVSKPGQPKKVFSAEGLRKALRPAYADSDSEETVDSDPYESQLAGDGIGDDGGMR